MPKATFLLKKPVGWRSGGAPYGRGTISGRNLVDSVPKFRQGWTDGENCVSGTEEVTLKFSQVMTWTPVSGDGGFVFNNNTTGDGPFSGVLQTTPDSDILKYDIGWATPPQEGDVIAIQYDGTGDFRKAGSDPGEDLLDKFGPVVITNCADPQSNVQITGAWTGEFNCGIQTTHTLTDNGENLTDSGDILTETF